MENIKDKAEILHFPRNPSLIKIWFLVYGTYNMWIRNRGPEAQDNILLEDEEMIINVLFMLLISYLYLRSIPYKTHQHVNLTT